MSDLKPILTPTKTMVEAYVNLLKFVTKEAHILEDKTGPALHKLIDSAGKNLSKLGEVTEEEAEKVSEYLKRDLRDAATFMEETGSDFKKWIAMDTIDSEIIEDFIIDQFKQAADQTTIELTKIKLAADVAEYHTGEITGPGVLICDECGNKLHFSKPGHIPPCAKCKATRYHRELHITEPT